MEEPFRLAVSSRRMSRISEGVWRRGGAEAEDDSEATIESGKKWYSERAEAEPKEAPRSK